MTDEELSTPSGTMEEEETPNEDASVASNSMNRPRTSEDFYLFCTYVLEYENYDAQRNEEPRGIPPNPSPPPLDSSGSSVNSESSVNSSHEEEEDKRSGEETDDDSDSLDLVTCYCGKPFARRPMIECSRCLTWIHLSCARIKKTHIPEVFHCAMCRSKKQRSPSPDAKDKVVKRRKRSA